MSGGNFVEKTLLQRWCDQTWLYIVYLLGIVMANTLLINWADWSVPQILMCLLTIAIPLHVFEENTAPGGFFFMNNLGFGSDNPIAYPQSSLTNMITNLGAEIYVIVVFVFTPEIEVACMTLVLVFGILETINHTREGIHMLKRYRQKGKTTIYGPGMITSWACLLPMSAYSIFWLSAQDFSAWEVVGGIGLLLLLLVPFVLIPLGVSFRVKSTRYAFTNIGYFEKYEKQAEGTP